MHFVSFVGTQIMAVLNPILSILQHENDLEMGRLEKITLFTTGYNKIVENAKKISNYLQKEEDRFSNKTAICIVDFYDFVQLHQLRKSESAICFNMAGGQSYHVSYGACLFFTEGNAMIYPVRSKAFFFNFTGDGIKQKELTYHNLVEISTLFDLQGIDFKVHKDREIHYELRRIFDNYGFSPSQPCLSCVDIDNIYFDVVWNRENELYALKVVEAGNDSHIDLARDLKRSVMSRYAFSELYHRNIGILTNLKPVSERLRDEAGSKIKVFYASRWDTRNIKDKLQCFVAGATDIKAKNRINGKTIILRENNSGSNPTNTLYTILAPNIMPTLLALWTHRPERAVLYYTPGDQRVERYRKALSDYGEFHLPEQIRTLEFRPVSIDGSEIITPQTVCENSVVNTTPGSKGHSAFLSIFALLHNLPIYTIETTRQVVQCLNENMTHLSLRGPSPVDFLYLSGIELKSTGINDLNLKLNENNAILWDFFTCLSRENDKGNFDIRHFPHRSEQVGEWNFRMFRDNGIKKCYIIRDDSHMCLTLEGGEWFEEFVAYAFLMAGADNVQVRIRTCWPKDYQQFLERIIVKRHTDTDIFQSDIDVVARFKGNYFLISCKAIPFDATELSLEKTVLDVEANARCFGTFCVPVICGFYEENDFQTERGIPVFGLKTLLNSDKLVGLLDRRLAELRKR